MNLRISRRMSTWVHLELHLELAEPQKLQQKISRFVSGNFVINTPRWLSKRTLDSNSFHVTMATTNSWQLTAHHTYITFFVRQSIKRTNSASGRINDLKIEERKKVKKRQKKKTSKKDKKKTNRNSNTHKLNVKKPFFFLTVTCLQTSFWSARM